MTPPLGFWRMVLKLGGFGRHHIGFHWLCQTAGESSWSGDGPSLKLQSLAIAVFTHKNTHTDTHTIRPTHILLTNAKVNRLIRSVVHVQHVQLLAKASEQ